MKNKIRFFIIVCLISVGLISMTSCKRDKVEDPEITGPAGFRISLSGTANPSTLYVPGTQPAVSSVITVRALNNDGTPVANRQVIFQQDGYGYFEGYRASDVRTTNASGVAQITFYIPPAANIKNTIMSNIIATLVDDGRLDNPISDINDVIPIRIIPYIEQGIIISGRVSTPTGVAIEDVSIFLNGGTVNANAVTLTRHSGNYEFYVRSGWYGTITPSAEGYTFTPPAYTFDENNPIIVDTSDLNFIAIFEAGNNLAADVTNWIVPVEGGTTSVNVYNSTGDAKIQYTITPNSNWVHVSRSSGTTPDSFTITVDENTTGEDRNGTVTLNATNIESSSVTITISQLSNEVPSDAVIAADITEINATHTGGEVTVNVYNATTEDAIEFNITVEYDLDDEDKDWLTVSKNSGSTEEDFDVEIATNYGPARTGYVWLTPTTTGVTNRVRITVNQDVGDYLALDFETWNADVNGDTTIITVTNPGDRPLSFTVTDNSSWISVTPTSNSTPGEISITVSANATSLQRSGIVTFRDINGNTITLQITQNGS